MPPLVEEQVNAVASQGATPLLVCEGNQLAGLVVLEDILKPVAEQMGRDVEFALDEQRLRPADSEVERLWADNTRARELAGWTPDYAGREGFKRGLGETIAWFGAPNNLRRYRAELYNI